MSIASTQVGDAQTPLFVMCHRKWWYTPRQYKMFQTFVNPKIVEFSEEQALAWEGCISNDEQLCLVERP
jgi:peptide deformylase